MTPNEEECLRIKAMTESELLDYVMDHPEYLSDPYYYDFGRAMTERHEQLRMRPILDLPAAVERVANMRPAQVRSAHLEGKAKVRRARKVK